MGDLMMCWSSARPRAVRRGAGAEAAGRRPQRRWRRLRRHTGCGAACAQAMPRPEQALGGVIGLLQPDAQVAVGIFELFQPMLGHERKQALQLSEVHPGHRKLRALAVVSWIPSYVFRVRGIPAEQ